jgi:hypothetical protein
MTSMDTPTIALQDDQFGGTVGADTHSVVLGIPHAAAITRACASEPAGEDVHPVLVTAAALAQQHQLRVHAHRDACDPFADDHFVAAATRVVNSADALCAVLIDRIDMWAVLAIADSHTGSLHTETFGQLVNHLVAAWTNWHVLNTATAQVGKSQVQDALHYVSELSIGYDDLVADLLGGRRRLPRVGVVSGQAA